MSLTPYQQIKKELLPHLSNKQLTLLPNKWEKVGDVLILVLHQELYPLEKQIAKVYAEVLSCKSVLKEISGISGQLRKPNVELLYGDERTVTMHKENGVTYKLDPSKIMFSSGNMDERIRMGNIVKPGEIIVDLFAGIGYFSLPMAVHGSPKKIFSCELNPIAYSFLKENIIINKVKDVITPLVGDNRNVAPRNVADRVVMGYFGDTYKYLPIAFQSLYYQTGIIHFHDTFPDNKVPNIPLSFIKEQAHKFHKKVELLQVKKVKSIAPGISHYVLDVLIEEK
jgi:tRNA wybutosine-synthesizing protein 2